MPNRFLAELNRMYTEKPESFEYFMKVLTENRPAYGTITLHFLSGSFHRCRVEDGR